MSELRLPKLLSDGCVLQRRKSIHIWGWDKAGALVTVRLEKDEVSGKTSEDGRFDLYLPARESGGPYELEVFDDCGGKITVKDVMLGLVWFCTGQSNMELPINRIKDKYPEFLHTVDNDKIRTFKITAQSNYHGPFEELQSGQWKSISQDTIMDFSATGTFFAMNLHSITGQTVGFIDASLGGSRISSWMSREMLEGYDELLAEADKYSDDEFVKSVEETNMKNAYTWHTDLNSRDEGLKENWRADTLDISKWEDITLPTFFKDTSLKDFIGVVWLRRSFDVPKALAGKKARLFLGTMVDSDIVYVNGVKVGETGYQYPPRKYDIPEGLTREKENTIAIRLVVENGMGRVTPGKEMKIFLDERDMSEDEKALLPDIKEKEAYLDGVWKYRVGAVTDQIEPTDFINWKSTGLYNAMTAPCHNFKIDGVVWYQGESNTHEPYDYADLTRRQVEGYRKMWGEDNLPYIAVQLPNFTIDLNDEDKWGPFRLTQAKVLELPSTGLVVTLGLGEDNDLHPVTKEPIGKRISLWAAHLKYGYNREYTGPVALSAVGIHREGKLAICLEMSHCEDLHVYDAGKGTEIKDFFIVDENGERHRASASIEGEKIILNFEGEHINASKVEYCCDDTYEGGLIVNSTQIPMTPFELLITERE